LPSPDEQTDPDLARAVTLISLYEIRGRLKQQQSENAGLVRARRTVEGVAERYRRLGGGGDGDMGRRV